MIVYAHQVRERRSFVLDAEHRGFRARIPTREKRVRIELGDTRGVYEHDDCVYVSDRIARSSTSADRHIV